MRSSSAIAVSDLPATCSGNAGLKTHLWPDRMQLAFSGLLVVVVDGARPSGNVVATVALRGEDDVGARLLGEDLPPALEERDEVLTRLGAEKS